MLSVVNSKHNTITTLWIQLDVILKKFQSFPYLKLIEGDILYETIISWKLKLRYIFNED